MQCGFESHHAHHYKFMIKLNVGDLVKESETEDEKRGFVKSIGYVNIKHAQLANIVLI